MFKMTNRQLARQLSARAGIGQKKSNGQRFWTGLSLRNAMFDTRSTAGATVLDFGRAHQGTN